MARKTIKRSRRLYSKMDKRKRRTRRKKRKRGKSKRVKKTQKGGCSICGGRPNSRPNSRPNNLRKVWVVNGTNPPDPLGVQTMHQYTEGIGLTNYRMATEEEIQHFKSMGYYVFPSQEIYNKYIMLKKYDKDLEKYKN